MDDAHVTMTMRDQKVRLIFDNRRQIIEPVNFTGYDMSDKLFDSLPLDSKETCDRMRFMSNFAYKLPYLKYTQSTKKTNYKKKTLLK